MDISIIFTIIEWRSKIGPAAAIVREDTQGLFTTVEVSKGSILGIKKETIVKIYFLNYSDYDTSNGTVIKTFSGNLTVSMGNNSESSYSNYIKDPFDCKKCNAV